MGDGDGFEEQPTEKGGQEEEKEAEILKYLGHKKEQLKAETNLKLFQKLMSFRKN